MNKGSNNLRMICLGFLISITIFIIICNNVDTGRLAQILLNINTNILFVAILFSLLVNVFVSAIKLKGILKILGLPLNIKEILFIKLGSIPFVSTFPLRTGELPKAVYLKKVFDFPYHKGIASVALELGGNLLALAFIFLMGSFLYPLNFNLAKSSAIAIVLMFILTIVIFPKRRSFKGNGVDEYGAAKVNRKGLIINFLSNFKDISPMNACFILGVSSVQILGELFVFFLISHSLGLSIPWAAVLFFIPLIMIITKLPVTFLGIGSREAAVIIFFYSFSEKTDLLSLGMLYSLVEYLIPTIAGLMFLPFFAKKICILHPKDKNFEYAIIK